VAVVVAIGVTTIVLADEKTETLGPTTGVTQPDRAGEWIRSVSGRTADVWAVGDAEPPAEIAIARLIRRTHPDRILYLGDVYPEGEPSAFRRWAKPFGGLLRRMAPVPGNHEWPQASEGYEPFWRGVTGQTPPTQYAFEAGGWQILSVNGELANPLPVERWLRKVTDGGGNCRIAFWHRPRFSAGRYSAGDPHAVAFWQALHGRVRIILNGHDHNMQRIHPREGVVQFISGAGGRELYPVNGENPLVAFADAHHHGALHLLLSPGRARWRFVRTNGHVLDSGSLSCRA
jgi:hypothetical protein